MLDLDSKAVEELLSALGAHLADEGHSFAIVVVGGSTLALRGWVERTTRDVDVIARAFQEEGQWVLVAPDPLPGPLVVAIERVARDYGLPQYHHRRPMGFRASGWVRRGPRVETVRHPGRGFRRSAILDRAQVVRCGGQGAHQCALPRSLGLGSIRFRARHRRGLGCHARCGRTSSGPR